MKRKDRRKEEGNQKEAGGLMPVPRVRGDIIINKHIIPWTLQDELSRDREENKRIWRVSF